MPYREKIAWIMLAALAVSFGAYFAFALSGDVEGLPNVRLLKGFAAAMVLQAVMVIVARLVLRMTSPKEARAKADEWDKAIAHRSASAAYYVMMTGLVIVGVVMPFNHSGWEIINGALATFVIAEFVRYGVIVLSYRRGWRG